MAVGRTTRSVLRTNLPIGRPLWPAQVAWVALALLVLAVFVLGIPGTIAVDLRLRPATQIGLAQAGIAPHFPAIYLTTLDTVVMLGFTIPAVLIFIRRRHDWWGMLAAMTLLLTGMLYTAPAYQSGVPLPLLAGLCALAEISEVAFVFMFPNGRFVPHWLPWLLAPLVIWRPWVWGVNFLPGFLASPQTGETFTYSSKGMFDTLALSAFFAVGIGAQVYRYRRVCTPTERQQMKWLIVGLVGALLIVGAYELFVNSAGVAQSSSSGLLIMRLAGRTARQLSLVMVPLALTYSILHYRLWEIDQLIGTTLVYVVLTGTVAGLYTISINLLQKLFVAVTGQQSDAAITISTLLLVAAFTPIKEALEGLAKRAFKEGGDRLRRLNALEEHMRSFVMIMDERHLCAQVLDEAVKAFQARGGAVALDKGNGPEVVYTAGDWHGEVDSRLTLPLEWDGRRLGALELGPRRNHLPYHEHEKNRLRQTANLLAETVALHESRQW